MKKQKGRKFSFELKAKVSLEATKKQLTLVQLSKKFEINTAVISRWKLEILANTSYVFKDKKESKEDGDNVDIEKLYTQIG